MVVLTQAGIWNGSLQPRSGPFKPPRSSSRGAAHSRARRRRGLLGTAPEKLKRTPSAP